MTGPLIAITGASGAVGTRFISMAHAKGFNLLALSRNRPETLANEIAWRPFDLDDPVEDTATKCRVSTKWFIWPLSSTVVSP